MQNPQNPYQPPIAAPTGEVYSSFSSNLAPGANNSGMGAQSVLPDELKGLNGGAFSLNWIWAIAHSTWIGLLCLVPYVGLIMSFVLLFKGNEFVWQNRKWESIEQFKAVQRKWMIWGAILFVLGIVSLAGLSMLGRSISSRNPGAFTPQTLPR